MGGSQKQNIQTLILLHFNASDGRPLTYGAKKSKQQIANTLGVINKQLVANKALNLSHSFCEGSNLPLNKMNN